jgi:hypothetical protein
MTEIASAFMFSVLTLTDFGELGSTDLGELSRAELAEVSRVVPGFRAKNMKILCAFNHLHQFAFLYCFISV